MSRLSSPPQYARIRMMIGQYGRTKQKNFVLFARLLGMTCKQKWVHFFGPVNGKTKVDSFIGYAAHLGLIRGGTPSGLYC